MHLYNITFNIEPEIRDEWLRWIREEYIPFVMETGLFSGHKLFRLLNETENEGFTYSLQFFTDSLDKADRYLEQYARKITRKHNETFRYKHVSFMTLLESVD